MRRLLAPALAALALVGLFAGQASAQDNYPTRPVKIIIAFPVGGLLDTVSRIVGEKMSGLLGQQFIIEARPGAGGMLATAAVAKADPDGYTVMMINDNHALNPWVFKNIPYDSIKDFTPIGFVGYTPLVFATQSERGAKNVKDVIEVAKKDPGGHHLRLGWTGQRKPPRRRDAGGSGQREATAHTLQRGGASTGRPPRRSREVDVREPGDQPAEHKDRQIDCAGSRG